LSLEFERLKFPIAIRCQARDCEGERALNRHLKEILGKDSGHLMQKPAPAYWQEKNTKLVFCSRDKARLQEYENGGFVGASLDKIGPKHRAAVHCPLYGSEYCTAPDPTECLECPWYEPPPSAAEELSA